MDNPALLTISLPKLKVLTGSLHVLNCPSLTSVGLPALEFVAAPQELNSIIIQYCGITTLDLPNLKTLYGSISIADNPSLSTVNIANLKYHGGVRSISFQRNQQLQSISLNSLEKANEILISSLDNLQSISLGSLKEAANVDIHDNAKLGMLSLPLLQRVGRITISANNSLTNLALPSLTGIEASYITLSNNKLPSSNINSLLSLFVGMNLTAKFILLSQLIPAPPTGQGLTDKTILINRENTVETD